MKKGVIRKTGKFFCLFIPVVVLLAGCTYQRHYRFKQVGMPEEVYINTPIQAYYTPDIVVLAFQSPGNTGGVGEKASMLLCSEMIKIGIEADIVFDNTAYFTNQDQLVRFARENKYDYIVTGDVLRFLNGGTSTDSHVEEEIVIYSVMGKRLQIVGHAKAVETARPLHSTDFIIVEGRGASAPSAETLLERNAGKFARLLSGMFSPNGTTH